MNGVLGDRGHCGVYATPQELGALQAAAERAGIAWFTVDLAPAGEKVRFLAECARDLRFPESFGQNWDAFADCLQDFAWRPAQGYVVRFANAQVFAVAAPDDFATAVEILRDTVLYWEARGKPFIALVDGAAGLPAFAAP